MKSLVSVLATILAFSWSPVLAEAHSIQADDFAVMRKEAVIKCSQEHNIKEDAIKDIMNHIQVAEDEEVKCWISCVMNEMAIMKERAIDWARFEDILTSGLADEEGTKVHQLVEACHSQVDQEDKNECQVAYSLADCKIKHWNEVTSSLSKPD